MFDSINLRTEYLKVKNVKTLFFYFLSIVFIPALIIISLNFITSLLINNNFQDFEFSNLTNQNSEKILIPLHNDILAESIKYNTFNNKLTISSTKYIYRVMPNPNNKIIHGYTGINNLGFRGENDLRVSDQATKKIVAFGDSCTFGWGIYNEHQTWPYLLQDKLNAYGKKFKVINLGQPGYSSTQGRALFNDWIDNIKPNYVILNFGWNDLWHSDYLTDSQLLKLLQHQNNPIFKFISTTSLYQFLKLYSTKIMTPDQKQFRSQNPEKRRVPLEETISNFEFMIQKSRKIGAKVIILLSLYGKKINELENIDSLNLLIVDRFKNLAIIPNLESLRHTSPSAENFYSKDYFHFNSVGSTYIAEEFSKIIK